MSNGVRNGEGVAAFEREFGEFVGAKYAIALCNGTATLHTALVALGVEPGDQVAVPPLTMSATTIAVLHAGAVPVFWDVRPDTWLMDGPSPKAQVQRVRATIPVSLYGLNQGSDRNAWSVDDAAQTLRSHSGCAFTSYSFQSSKVLPLGEGGMLVTDDEELATKAREFSSLGYRMRADQPRIDPATLKSPKFQRHHSLGWNYRMSDLVAQTAMRSYTFGPSGCALWDVLRANRRECAAMYREAISGCDWLTPQYVPDGWAHDYWCYTVATHHLPRLVAFDLLAAMVEKHGGERPYAAWRLTYDEPAFKHLAPAGTCPIAEDLQPRLMQMATNKLDSAERNATALAKAIREIGG